MNRSLVTRIIAALFTVVLVISSCSVASAEYAHEIEFILEVGKNAYGPSTGYQRRPADTTSDVWHCYLDDIGYTCCGWGSFLYEPGDLSVYLYCINKVRNCVASEKYQMLKLGGYGDKRDAHPFKKGVPLENKLAEYKVVAVKNNSATQESNVDICVRFSWQPY